MKKIYSNATEALDGPLTGKGVVDLIIINLGVLEVDHKGLHVVATAPGVSHDDIRAATDAAIV